MDVLNNIDHYLEVVSKVLEMFGVIVIALSILVASVYFLLDAFKSKQVADAFSNYRIVIGKGILLGLEILVAADIVGTVLIEPSFENVAVLGLIVLIRTFLSYSLEVELEGRFPWQKKSVKGK